MLSPTAAGVRVPGSPEEVRSAGETNMSREENKSKFGGRLGYILNDSTALPRVTFSNGLIRTPHTSQGRRCNAPLAIHSELYADKLAPGSPSSRRRRLHLSRQRK